MFFSNLFLCFWKKSSKSTPNNWFNSKFLNFSFIWILIYFSYKKMNKIFQLGKKKKFYESYLFVFFKLGSFHTSYRTFTLKTFYCNFSRNQRFFCEKFGRKYLNDEFFRKGSAFEVCKTNLQTIDFIFVARTFAVRFYF